MALMTVENVCCLWKEEDLGHIILPYDEILEVLSFIFNLFFSTFKS